VLFIENKDATSVISKATKLLGSHPRCLQVLDAPRPEERSDFILKADDDPAREIRVALLPVVIGRSERDRG
jgi:hypothetical protein